MKCIARMETGAGLTWVTGRDDLSMSGEVQYWPLLIGWTVVVLLLLYGWKRQAAIAAAGMAIVTYAVLSVGS